MKITNPELKVVRFANEDVIATSFGPLSGTNGLFYIPAGEYSGTYSGTGNYVEFNGTLGNYSGGKYEITNIYNATADIDPDRSVLVSKQTGMVFMPGTGTPVPASVLETYAKQGYDAFSYGGGKYYTNGVSYYESYWQ